VLIYHTSLQRNKRVALAYIKERLARLENLAWEMGYVPERLKPNLVVAEHEFFSDYCALLHNYTKQFDSSLHIDMTESTKPPNDVFVDVRVKQEIGQIFTEDGAVTLAKGTQLNMRRADAEPLIRQGKLEHIG
jgi:GINS complex subunit 1